MTLASNSVTTPTTEPTKTMAVKKKDPFYGTEAFKKILFDALTTVADINPAENQSERTEYYLSMVDSALEGKNAPIKLC